MTTETIWIPTLESLPPEGFVVETKIDDEHGVRNERRLKRQGRLWFSPDGKLMMYYEPTHWSPIR